MQILTAKKPTKQINAPRWELNLCSFTLHAKTLPRLMHHLHTG